jgi:hypothetical protein
MAFHAILNARWPNLGWWHQISETWLIVDLTDTLTAAKLRDAAREAFPGIPLVVLETAGPVKWAGFGQPKDYEWMKGSWDREQ